MVRAPSPSPQPPSQSAGFAFSLLRLLSMLLFPAVSVDVADLVRACVSAVSVLVMICRR